ncbi:hypothetical protein PFICI_04417 [Pestalotiopsis fici W106-1]|uniref:Mitochondrial division protein 1 n=1 Tax=Pestalotiopsis fici (strain W106-1 / CGMCC3.15140) TaxID=1229662 RepID=W3XBH4_PESFW|nr:uncharacterized protein PFICI_04417 [Pestalotiopsis fici W106-1]ETS82541.1 hypothetical protein PFICI_04417 [Pestalotiopsis fici W106-1]
MDARPIPSATAETQKIMNISENTFGDNTHIHHGDIINNLAFRKPLPTARDAEFGSFAEQHNRDCLPGTRVDLLREIMEWTDNPSTECIFWLNGMAGTGKSTISRTVARSLQERGALGASFFFKRGEQDRGHARLFFTTIASQLVIWKPALQGSVAEARETYKGIEDKSMREQFEKLILQPLSKIQRLDEPVVVVIDALDECDQDETIGLIIQLLPQVKALTSVRMKIFITSRPELPIRLGFKSITGTYKDIALHQIPEPVIEHDILLFFQSEFARIRGDYYEDIQLPSGWPDNNAIQTLVQMAVPLFIFATTICRFVADPVWSDPVSQLEKVLEYRSNAGESELEKLESTYLPILNRLIDGTAGLKRSRLVDEFRAVVGPIVLLATPLSIAALARLLDIRPAAINGRLRTLHSLISVSAQPDTPIRIFHLSFRDFLVDPIRRHEFCVGERECHERLAHRCLQVLEANLKRDVCNLQAPDVAGSAVDPSVVKMYLPAHVEYACLYWAYHIEQSKGRVTEVQIDLFLQRHLLHWLEALCLLKKIRASIAILETLSKYVQPGTMLEGFLRDASRFTLNCIPVMIRFPLQLYNSAIVFSPQNSEIRNAFIDEMPSWISPFPVVDPEWNTFLVHTLEGHGGPVNSVVWSHDATRLATASRDKTVKIWHAVTGQCELTLEGHSDSITSVTWSQDAAWLATASNDYTIKVWDPVTSQCVSTLEDDTTFGFVGWSHDAQWLASISSHGGTIKIWERATGRCKTTIRGHEKDFYFLSWSHTAALFAYGSHYDVAIKIWDSATNKCITTLQSGDTSVRSITWLRSGTNQIMSAAVNGTVKTWDVTTNQCTSTVKVEGRLHNITWSHDATRLASAFDYNIKIYDLATGQIISTFGGPDHNINAISWSSNIARLASASHDRTIKIWDPADGQYVSTLESHSARVTSVAFSYNAVYLASASADHVIKIWEPETGQYLSTLEGLGKETRLMSWSYDTSHLAVLSDDCTISIWDIQTGDHVSIPVAHNGVINSISWSYTAARLASASDDDTIRIWDPATGECIFTLKGHKDFVNSVTWSNDSTRLISASEDCTIKIWDVATGQCVSTLKEPSGWASAVAVSQDMTRLALATPSFAIKIWDPVNGQHRSTLGGHGNYVRSLAWSHNAARLASAADDKTIKIWDLATGQCMSSLAIDDPFCRKDFQFQKTELYHLQTTLGAFEVQIATEPLKQSDSPPLLASYGFDTEYTWLSYKDQNLLWLPSEYRPSTSTFHGRVAAIGCRSGRVFFFNFAKPNPLS